MAILKKNKQDSATVKEQMAVLLLGGNLGDVKERFNEVIAILSSWGKVKAISSLYRSEAWGMEEAPDFLNQAVLLETLLPPQKLMNNLLELENRWGRKRSPGQGYQSREIDIDILFYNDLVLNTETLIIPHPRLHERRFALVPLVELIPEFTHPVLKKTISIISKRLKDNLYVERV